MQPCPALRSRVLRALSICVAIVSLFAAGCGTSSNAQFAVATTSAALTAGSVSVGGGAYPATTLNAPAGTAPYTWAVTSGSLPAGLTLNNGGTISGSPTAPGTSNFNVMVTDSASPTPHTATGSLTITINGMLTITSTGSLSTAGEAGAAYVSTALTETGGVGPFN